MASRRLMRHLVPVDAQPGLRFCVSPHELVIGIATLYAGLIVALPLIGHATWHACRATIDEEGDGPHLSNIDPFPVRRRDADE